MSEVTLSKVNKEYGVKKILTNVSFTINKHDRIGLIGRNGCGKTTIFRLITDCESCDTGEVLKRKGLKIGCLDQVSHYPENTKVIDILTSPFKEVNYIKNELNKLENELEDYCSDKVKINEIMKLYEPLQNEYENLGGYTLQDQIKNVCIGLKISKTLKYSLFNDLSGGEQVKIELAKILLEKVDLLLLDEPTNHLDIESVEWLEGFLKTFEGAVVAISHDRFFLDKITTKIIELEHQQITITKGNYSTHVFEKGKRLLNLEREYRQQQNEIKLLEESIQKTRTTGINQRNPALLKKAITLEAKLSRIIPLPKPVAVRKMRLKLSNTNKSSNIIFRMRGISKSFGDKEVLKDLDLIVRSGEKVAVLGANGVGKSTLIKIVMGKIEADSGDILIGVGNKVAYLDQNLHFENDSISILYHLTSYTGFNEENARSLLAKFLFTKEEVNKTIESLSGGERTRLKLAIIFSKDINVLILDEPTNHLDIDSREILEEVISGFSQTLVFVSHDRYFIAKMADRVVEIVDKKIKDYEGDYNVYLATKNPVEIVKKSFAKSNDERARKKQEDRNNKKRETEITQLELDIEKYEAEIIALEKEMYQNKTDFEKLGLLHKDKLEIEKIKDDKLERWCELNDDRESVQD